MMETIMNNNTLKSWIFGEEKNTDNIPDVDTLFDAIDTNKGGFILFDEFASWAIGNNMDMEPENHIDIKQPDVKRITVKHLETKKNNDDVQSLMEDLEATMKLLDDKLPYQKNNKDAYQKRMKQFRAMDVNGNGYLSLAEIDLAFLQKHLFK